MANRRAQELIDATAGAPPAEVSPELARLLGAVQVLKESAPEPEAPTGVFASRLRSNLLARYDELTVVQPEPAPKRIRRLAWVTIPAVAVAAALVLALVLFVLEPAGEAPAVARLTVQNGVASVLPAEGKAASVSTATDVRLGDSISTASGSRATITFENRNIVRLEAGTELKVFACQGDSITLTQKSGKTYNRVMKGASYSVIARLTIAQSVGTAFGVDITDAEVSVPGFEGTAKAGPLVGGKAIVAQGNIAHTSVQNSELVVTVSPLDLATLDYSWLAFNRDLDREAGFPLGVLEGLDPTPPGGVLPPGTPPSSAPGSSSPASTQPAGSQPPGSQPQPPPLTPTVTLSLSDPGPPVVINWGAQNVQDADAVAVLRAEGAGTPSYPGNTLTTVSTGQSSFSDQGAREGQTLTYRVAYLKAGALLAYSNPVTAVTPEPPPPPPDLSLSGDPSASSMYLSWSLSSGSADAFAVLRAEGRTPGYPSDVYDRTGGGSSGKYIDYKVGPNVILYRVVALSGGKVLATSNVVEYIPSYQEPN